MTWNIRQVALYADRERGKYPVWQSLDHENFFPGSGVIFATVTVRFRADSPALVREAIGFLG